MRILFANWTDRMAGGAEDYIASAAQSLTERGHEVALAYQSSDSSRPALLQHIEVQAIGPCQPSNDYLRSTLEKWSPDIVYAHGVLDSKFEDNLRSLAPSVYFIHNYYGTCISGLKSHQFPIVQACSKRFGPSCLLHYLPRRCGGANPLTMLRRYKEETERLTSIREYNALITHSRHMTREYEQHGIDSSKLFNFVGDYSDPTVGIQPSLEWDRDQVFNLLFVGRMEASKGGDVLLAALAPVLKELQRPIHLTMAGDGRERQRWESLAKQVTSQHTGVTVDFTGWLDTKALTKCYEDSDLLIVPSLWPEPFGRVGLDAGAQGVPAVAFASGGIPDWLRDGLSGFLAKGDRLMSESLAQAITAALKDRSVYQRLQEGARKMSRKFGMDEHLNHLERVFRQVLENNGCNVPEPSFCL